MASIRWPAEVTVQRCPWTKDGRKVMGEKRVKLEGVHKSHALLRFSGCGRQYEASLSSGWCKAPILDWRLAPSSLAELRELISEAGFPVEPKPAKERLGDKQIVKVVLP